MVESDEEDNYNELRRAKNRKQRRSGPWQSLGLDHVIHKGLERKGYRQPTPIQRKAIPIILDGKDVVAMSRTGSGKTAAFIVPMLQKLKQRETKGIRALLLSPTRELALQTFKFTKELGRFTGLRCAVLVGGDNMDDQFSALHGKPDILLATPGRLLHVLAEMNLRLSSLQYLVFDEADRLFEMGFAEQLNEILTRVPEHRQTLLFSATLPKMLVDFAKAGLTDPTLVRLDVDNKVSDKLSMVFTCCRTEDKAASLLQLVRSIVNAGAQTIVFCATMKHVEHLCAVLNKCGFDCAFLHSQLDSTARKLNIERFRTKMSSVLIVTDVAARGVDIPLLENAINYHFPAKPKLFVHRVGRVARAGHSGTSYSLISPDEYPYVVDLFLFLGRPISFAHPDSEHKNGPVIGNFPQSLIDLEVEFLKGIHDSSEDLVDMRRKAANALTKYIRTRPPPSSESVRRVKMELKSFFDSAAVHPIFKIAASKEDLARNSFLQRLHSFKPQTTIFEIQSSTKALPAAVMKAKRKAHWKNIKEKAENTSDGRINFADGGHTVTADVDNCDDYLLRNVTEAGKFIRETDVVSGEERKTRKRKAAERRADEKKLHFIEYMPSDIAGEGGLAVDKGFNIDARAASIEIGADDADGMFRQERQKKWNRKLKKFVGESGNNAAKKRIKTEEGNWIPASYKSGRYARWIKKQQLDNCQPDESDDEEDGDMKQTQKRTDKRQRAKHYRSTAKNKHLKSELKNPDQILKERIRKEEIKSFQAERRQRNLERKARHLQSQASRRKSLRQN